eukprot:CAMPEP_0197863702 /NCGR_PEP_ID=MMETSP1438-20131217/41362_1 /TAXON_ID=1461541 /ORGANISM="Pterosperma sp., Strain CCMP1384" /LENGTH=360 /DNA_ID=CAMNT_0043481703 /DNA_START=192 /DNA_END=1274 /DNA_ORIENTATION=+
MTTRRLSQSQDTIQEETSADAEEVNAPPQPAADTAATTSAEPTPAAATPAPVADASCGKSSKASPSTSFDATYLLAGFAFSIALVATLFFSVGDAAFEIQLASMKTSLEAKLDDVTVRLGEMATANDVAELRDELNALSKRVDNQEAKLESIVTQAEVSSMIEKTVVKTVDDALEEALAEKPGLPDYALYSGGGKVIDHSVLHKDQTTEPVLYMLLSSVLGVKAVHPKANEWVISPQIDEVPGNCLALNATTGYIEIRLRQKIVPSAFTLEHIPQKYAYDTSSAPKSVTVDGWAHSEEAEEQAVVPLGAFSYDTSASEAVQTFTVDSKEAVDHVKFNVLSNHGNPDYTCVYRFRVHGTPV